MILKTDAIWWRVKRPSIHVSLMTRLHESCVTSISEVQITHVAEMKPHQSMTTMTRTIDPRMYTHTDGFPISPRTSGPLLGVIRKHSLVLTSCCYEERDPGRPLRVKHWWLTSAHSSIIHLFVLFVLHWNKWEAFFLPKHGMSIYGLLFPMTHYYYTKYK